MIVLILSVGIVSANDNNTNIKTSQVEKIHSDYTDKVDLDKAVENKINNNVTDNKIKSSNINKKSSNRVKGVYYAYDEDEEYGFNEGSEVILSYKKVKTNQYNITARIINSYNHPVKEGEITVNIRTNNKNQAKTLSFHNGPASFIQKFHTMGNVKIYSSDYYTVSYEPLSEDGEIQEVSYSKRSRIYVSSNTLTFKVYTAYTVASVPKTCDVDEKVPVYSFSYDDDELATKGKVSLYLDDKYVTTKKVVNGSANFNLKINKTGKHIIETDYITSYGETYYDTNVVEITRKKENIELTLPKYGDTCEEIVITTKVNNDTEKINKGYVLLKNNGKQFAKVKVKNGETTSIYRLPNFGDIYTISAEYVNNKKTLAKDSGELNVYNSEYLSYDDIPKSKTDSKIVFNATVTNPYVTVNYGTIEVSLNNKILLKKAVKNGKVAQAIKIPNKSGIYDFNVQYIKKNYVIIEDEQDMTVTDSEKLTYTIPKTLLPDNKYTFKVKVTSPYVKVNNGQVKYKLGTKTVTSKVKNGVATISFKTKNKEQNLTATVSYIKYNKQVDKKTSTINIHYTHKSYVYPPTDTIRGNKVKIEDYVYNTNYVDANSGKVIFYVNNKKIGTAKVKQGKAVLYYKVNLKSGIYKVSSIYYDKNNKKVAKEDYEYMTVVNKLTNDKNVKVKTFTSSDLIGDNSQKSIGSSEYVGCSYEWRDPKYTTYISLTNSYWYYPKYNKLVRARIYYMKNNKIFTKIYGQDYIFGFYRITVDSDYAPYKVEIAYREMNARDKRANKEYFGVKY